MADSVQPLAETAELNSGFQPNSVESEILLYLYNHPAQAHSTVSLAFNLRAPQVAPDELPQIDEAYTKKQQEDLLTMQTAVESLVLTQCLDGVREQLGPGIQFSSLKLTRKGEEQAIRVKRSLQELASGGN